MFSSILTFDIDLNLGSLLIFLGLNGLFFLGVRGGFKTVLDFLQICKNLLENVKNTRSCKNFEEFKNL